MKTAFYLEAFPDDASTGESENLYTTERAAISRAMSMAKRLQMPIDVRWPSGADENARYVGTAWPSEYHSKGARWSRSELRD